MEVNVIMEGLMWWVEREKGWKWNVEMGSDRFRARYGEEPDGLVMKKAEEEEICGLRVMEGNVAPGMVMFVRRG